VTQHRVTSLNESTSVVVVVQFGKIPLVVRDDGYRMFVISSEARNLFDSMP